MERHFLPSHTDFLLRMAFSITWLPAGVETGGLVSVLIPCTHWYEGTGGDCLYIK